MDKDTLGWFTDSQRQLAARQYKETALWSSADDAGESLDDDFGPCDLPAGFADDCLAFIEANGADVVEFMGVTGCDIGQVGHDFWLTRNRHGAGFWDRDAGPSGAALTAAAHAYGSVDIVVSDGKLVTP